MQKNKQANKDFFGDGLMFLAGSQNDALALFFFFREEDDDKDDDGLLMRI